MHVTRVSCIAELNLERRLTGKRSCLLGYRASLIKGNFNRAIQPTPCLQKVGQMLLTETLKVVNKFPSNLAYSIND